MSDDKTPTADQSPWQARITAELAEIRRTLGRLANATLKIHYAQARSEKTSEANKATLDRVETKLGVLGEKLVNLDADVEHVEKSVDRVREDLTPVHAVALPTKEELTIEEHVRVAKSWAGFLWRHRDIVLAIIVVISMGLHALQLLATHGH